MNSLHQLQIWLSRRRALILVIVLGVLLWGLPAWLKETPPLITRTLGSSTQHVDVLWFNQDMFYMMTANAGGVAYVVPLAGDNLMAIDVRDGTTMWDVQLLPERSGVTGLLANQNTVFVVTTLSVDAYEAETGNLKWSTKSGSGHVSIISQLDSEVVRVYYGDQLYEVDSKTGKVLSIAPKDTVVWISGDVVLRNLSANFLTAFDRQSGEQLWDKAPSFYLGECQEPQEIGREILIVANAPAQAWSWGRGICALDLRTGKYNWCRHETYISRIAIDHQYQLGYAVRSDFVLVTIDLQTGDVLGETGFLSSAPPQEHPTSIDIATSDGIVIISFGDSAQTFGLKLR